MVSEALPILPIGSSLVVLVCRCESTLKKTAHTEESATIDINKGALQSCIQNDQVISYCHLIVAEFVMMQKPVA